MTYVCTEVVNEICRSWIQNTNILNGLPSGMGSEIGWQLTSNLLRGVSIND